MKKISTLFFMFLLSGFIMGQEEKRDMEFYFSFDNFYAQLNGRSGEANLVINEYDPNVVFHLKENNVIGDEIKKTYPDLKSFNIVENKVIVGTCTFNSGALWLDYSYSGKMVNISPDFSKGARGASFIQYAKKAMPFGMCGTEQTLDGIHDIRKLKEMASARKDIVQKLEFRMAIVATGEFYQANGATAASSTSAIVASVAGISAIYTKHLSVSFKLVNSFSFSNPTTDPFIPDLTGGPGRTTQAATQVPLQFPVSSYDIGHVLHNHDSGDGWSTGGLAQLESVCKTGKAAGWSGSFKNSGFDWLSLFAHEIGHQFGMQHTFNGTGENCTDNISLETAVEIGSGTTIMSYNGLCLASNNTPSNGESDNYFHYVSSLQAVLFIAFDITNCVTAAPLSNNYPETQTNPCGAPSFTMPKGTPFYHKGTATDEDGDQLFYAWDQYDEDGPGKPTQGRIGASAGNNKVAPLMKSVPPSLSNERYFPDRGTVAKGNGTDPFQALPNVDRTIAMAFSARDLKDSGGGLSYEEFEIVVDATGPLSVVAPNGNETFAAGQTAKIKWNPNGSEMLCANSAIYLSIDGGQTFPILLAKNVDYGLDSIDVTLPGSINTTLARIKFTCDDYDCFQFYDISNANFKIESLCNAPLSIICPSNNLSFDKGVPELDLSLSYKNGTTVSGFSKRIINTSPVGPLPLNNIGSTGCTTKSNTNFVAAVFSVSKTGSYNFSVDPDAGGGYGFVTIVNDATYNPASPCGSFIASSGVDAGASSVSARSSMTANLTECTNYRMLFFNYEQLPKNTVVTNISGPGLVVEQPTTPVTDFSYTYVAVRKTNNIVTAVSDVADFRNLGPGLYDIFGVNYKSSGIAPPNNTNYNNYIGKDFSTFYIDGDCFISSSNSFELEVKGKCSLDNVVLAEDPVCEPMDNSFTAPLVLDFASVPSGKINAGGQLFDITTSPQIINYKGLSDGSTNSIDVFFDAEPDCIFTLSIKAPLNCCPFESGIEPAVRGCEGQPVTIKANPDLGLYNWFDPANVLVGTSSELTTSTAGKYKLVIKSLTGCEKSQDIDVSFEATPTISLPANITICEGVKFQIAATTNASFLEWFKNDTLVQSGSNKILEVNAKGTYKVKAGNSVQCQVDASIVVSTKPAPKPNLGIDKDICEGSSTTLSITDNGTIQWFLNNNLIAGQSGKTISVKDEGVYKVVVKGANDCENQDIINVNVFALPTVNAGADIKFCEGKEANISATSSTQNFSWQKDGVAYSEIDLAFTTNLPGKYKIIAQNEIGCKVADSVVVTKNALPVVNLGVDKVGCIGTDIMLTGPAGTGLVYKWLKNGADIPGGQQISVNTLGVYSLIVTDANSCSNIDMINVDFKPGPSVSLNDSSIEFCEGESFDLIATTTATKIEWLRNGTVITGATGKTLKVTQAGNYMIKASGSVGGASDCTVEQTATAIINPKLLLNVNDTTACEGETITISSNVNAAKYTWSLNGTPLASTKTYKPTAAGTYKLEVETNKQCKSSDDVIVTFSARPSISIPTTGQYCKGETLLVNANSNGTSFKWLKNNLTIPSETKKEITITSAGTYVIEASFNGACPKKDTILVVERPLPIVSLGEDRILCPNDSITLDAQNNGSKYIWSSGDTVRTIKIKNPGVAKVTDLKVTVTNQFGCKAFDEVKVTNQPKIKINLTSSAPGICGGDSVTLTVAGGGNYNWSGPIGTFNIIDEDQIVVFPTSTAIYKVVASDNCPSNIDTASKEIKLFALANASAGNDTCVIKSRTIKLKATGGVSYLWDADASIIKGANSSTPEVGPATETTYFVTIKDANGCIQKDSVKVCIIEDPLSLIKQIDMITPNGDGANDNLEFIGLEAFPENSLLIYNRWGNVIFEKSGYQRDSERFDGTRNGEELPADTYFYVLKFDKFTYKQAITILRDKN
jgi:gliding motility-associated-like protein